MHKWKCSMQWNISNLWHICRAGELISLMNEVSSNVCYGNVVDCLRPRRDANFGYDICWSARFKSAKLIFDERLSHNSFWIVTLSTKFHFVVEWLFCYLRILNRKKDQWTVNIMSLANSACFGLSSAQRFMSAIFFRFLFS